MECSGCTCAPRARPPRARRARGGQPIRRRDGPLHHGHGLPDVAGRLGIPTTSLGFFAFLPTAYAGVAELGLISGTSMFIGLIMALTLLPTLMEALPVRSPRALEQPPVWKALAEPFVALPYRHRGLVRLSSATLGIAALLLLTQGALRLQPEQPAGPLERAGLHVRGPAEQFRIVSLDPERPGERWHRTGWRRGPPGRAVRGFWDTDAGGSGALRSGSQTGDPG